MLEDDEAAIFYDDNKYLGMRKTTPLVTVRHMYLAKELMRWSTHPPNCEKVLERTRIHQIAIDYETLRWLAEDESRINQATCRRVISRYAPDR